MECANVLLVFLAFTHLLTVVADNRPVPLQWIGKGYNVLYADPDLVGFGRMRSDPVDPGRTHTTILEYTYKDNHKDFSGTFDLPDQITYTPLDNQASTSVHNIYFGAKSFQNKLKQSVSLSVGVPAVADVAFTAGYENENQQSQSTQTAFIESRSTHATAVASFNRNLDPKRQAVTEDFVRAVCKLPTADADIEKEKNKFINFFKEVGTHVILKITIGNGTISRKTLTIEKMAEMASNSQTFGMSGSGSAQTVQVKASTELQMSEVKKIEEQTKDQTASVFHIGSEKVPGVIFLQADDVFNYVNKPLWKSVCAKKRLSNKACCNKTNDWKKAIKRALKQYPRWLKLVKPTDPELSYPIAWPLGFYGLPRTNEGCPDNDDNSFNWMEGIRFQREWGNTAINPWPFPFVNDSVVSIGDNEVMVKQAFCIKDKEKGSVFAKAWPKGSYCIYQYNSCPSGFSNGFIWWDDVGKQLSPSHEGFLPYGVYDDDTKIYFCCRTDGDAINEILLPTTKPFFLLKKGSKCQRVAGMKEKEYIYHMDVEDMAIVKGIVRDRIPGLEFLYKGPSLTGSTVTSGSHPIVDYKSSTQAYVKMWYCYYVKE